MKIQQYSQNKLEKETNKIKTDKLVLKEKQFATVNLGSELTVNPPQYGATETEPPEKRKEGKCQ